MFRVKRVKLHLRNDVGQTIYGNSTVCLASVGLAQARSSQKYRVPGVTFPGEKHNYYCNAGVPIFTGVPKIFNDNGFGFSPKRRDKCLDPACAEPDWRHTECRRARKKRRNVWR